MSDETVKQESQGLYSKANFELAKFASRKKSRYTLQAILVTPNETVATDGHRLVRCSTVNSAIKLEDFPVIPTAPELGPGRFLLSVDATNAVAKNMPKKQPIPILNYAAPIKPIEGDGIGSNRRQVGFVTTDLQKVSPTIERETEGKFPDWEAVMPRADDAVLCRFAVSATYLAELAQYFAKLDSRGGAYDAVTVTVYRSFKKNTETGELVPIDDVHKGIKIEGGNTDSGQKAEALLMPMRL